MKLTKIDWNTANKQAEAEVDSFVARHPRGFYGSAIWVGSVLHVTWLVAAGAMLVSFGAWGLVIWPFVLGMALRKATRSVKMYKAKLAELGKA